MGLTDYLGKKRRLMIVKEVEFGVYLGNKDDKVLLPKKQVPKDVEVGDPVEVFLYKDSSDRLIATTQEPKITLDELAVLKVADTGRIGAFLDWGLEKDLLLPFKEQTAKVKKGETALDLGTGTGIIPILLKTKTNGKHFTGLEIQKECADMAGRSVRYNHLEDDVEIVRGDIKEAADIFGAASFDVVTSNPPYMIGQHGLRNPDMPKAIARHEVLCNLEDVVSQASKVLKERGRFYMVHRPFRLAEIMNVLTMYRLEPKKMQLVYPYIDREPNMVLIEALKGGNSRVTVEPPLIVYKEPGVYTENILKIYDMI